MSITSLGNNLVHYEALGRGDPLLFVHGWLGSWRYWWPSMQQMAQYHRVFAIDLWGFGDSSKNPDHYTLEAYTTLIADFVQHLGITKPVLLVGHALGSVLATRYASLKPESVNRVVTVSLPLTGNQVSNSLLSLDAGGIGGNMLGQGFVFPEVLAEMHKTDFAAVRRTSKEVIGLDLAGEFARLTCPVLLVHGGRDTIVTQPSKDIDLMQHAAGNRVAVTFDACNHFPMLEEAAGFTRLLLEFFRSDEDSLADLSLKKYWRRRTH